KLVHLLLEGANLRHLAVHMEVLLQLHPRLDHLSRHRKVSPSVLESLRRGCSSQGPRVKPQSLGRSATFESRNFVDGDIRRAFRSRLVFAARFRGRVVALARV